MAESHMVQDLCFEVEFSSEEQALLRRLRALSQPRSVLQRLARQFPPPWLQSLECGLKPSTAPSRPWVESGLAAERRLHSALVGPQTLAQREFLEDDGALDTGHSQRDPEVKPGHAAAVSTSDLAELDRGALFITNAGLDLVGPYLPRLFDTLGLLQNGAFVDAAATERAVLLTQYLVTGQTQTAEPLLLLNKLLCGLPLDSAVAREIDITDADHDVIESLLWAITSHWTALGQTSPAGLQATFLQREGRLDHVDGAWQLQVQPRTFDMLLDRLPWGYALLKHPWMPEVLRVNWR